MELACREVWESAVTPRTILMRIASCFSPYRAPEALPRPNPRKWGKITEKLQKIKKYSENTFFVIFRLFFPIFGGWIGKENFVIFPHFSGISAPGGFRGSVRGKTTRKMRNFKAFAGSSHAPCYHGGAPIWRVRFFSAPLRFSGSFRCFKSKS